MDEMNQKVSPPCTSENGRSSVQDGSAKVNALSRRRFLGASAAAWTVGTMGIAALPVSSAVSASAQTASDSERPENGASINNVVGGQARKRAAFQARLQTALEHFRSPLIAQANNGDEALYSEDHFIGNYSKGLVHDQSGNVQPDSYQAFRTACVSGLQSDFEAVPMGGVVPLVSPQSGLVIELEGADTADLTIPPAPALASAQRAGEMVELYWHALARDVPFSQYGQEPITAAAIQDLNQMSDFRGPKQNGKVTAQTLFRGFTAGDLVGPYISQFFLMPMGFGLGNLAIDGPNGQPAQLYNKFVPNVDYMTDSASWLGVQNGQATVPAQSRSIFFAFGQNQFQSTPGYLSTARDISGVIHVDELFQHYFWAAAEILGRGFPLSSGNPYSVSATPNEVPFATFGGAYIPAAMVNAAMRAIHAVWYQKYYVHRDLRPEEYGGWVHNTLNNSGLRNYNLHRDVLNSAAVSGVFSKFGTFYLPMAFPEGCPSHPSYGSGHATVAGASITMLKAFFDCSASFINLGVVPQYSPDGVTLSNYVGNDVGQITIGTELNKLASNVGVGRNLAGMHWRSDYQQSLLLGEQVAINLLRDQVNTFSESDVFFNFPSFEGKTINIQKTGTY